MIDICTVVFEPELPVLRQQARSIELYCADIGIDRIWVMVNDHSSIDPAWWGSMAAKVRVIHRKSLGTQWHQNGWVSQQALKILGSAQSLNQWCMIVDAKTLFVRPVSLKEVFVNGRAATGTLSIYPVFEASKQITNQLFDIDLPAQIGPGGVPFLVEPHMVRSMIQWIEAHTGQQFAEYFQDQGRLTEFMLYSGWVWYRHQSFDHRYSQQVAVRPVNLCHSEVDKCDHKIKLMQHSATLTVSVHRDAWPRLTDSQQQQYLHLLNQKGLI